MLSKAQISRLVCLDWHERRLKRAPLLLLLLLLHLFGLLLLLDGERLRGRRCL